jgi:hypothetical protein
MTDTTRATAGRGIAGHVAVKALFKSVLINMAAPAILYRLAVPHFAGGSLLPLAISGVPPMLWLTYGLVKLRAIDFLGLFAAENVVVSMVALVLSHCERDALIGRSLQNVILAAIFLTSLAFVRPLMFYMSRQLSTGNDPAKRASFDLVASQPNAMHAYRILTWGWTAALLVKAAGAYVLAAHLGTTDFLVVSPLWDLVSDSALVAWTVFYGRTKLASLTNPVEPSKTAGVTA